MVRIRVVTCWMILDASKDRRQNDANEREKGRESCQLRERIKSPGKRENERNESTNGRKAYGADCVVAHSVKIARYDAWDVDVSEEHQDDQGLRVTYSTWRP